MRLSNEEIKKIVFGAVNVECQEDGLRFYKCTEKQIKAWYKLRTDLGERSETTTGITIDFHTDSKKITFVVSGSKFEILINGNLTAQYNYEDNDEVHEINVSMPEGENRCTLVFPSHFIGVLKSLEIDDGACIKPHPFDMKMLFIGDSITQGWNSKYDCLSFAHRTAAVFNAERVINGIGGAFYHPTTFDKPEFDPDVVIVAYGSNDFLVSPCAEELQRNVSGYLQQIKQVYGNKKVFVIIPTYRFDRSETAMGTYDECREIIAKEAEKYEFPIIDGYDMMPHHMDFYDDTIHPIDLGFGIYAEKLVLKLRKWFN